MRTVTFNDVEYTCPDISHEEDEQGELMFRINEGPLKGIYFKMENIVVGEDGNVTFDLGASEVGHEEELNEIIQQFVTCLLIDSIRHKERTDALVNQGVTDSDQNQESL